MKKNKSYCIINLVLVNFNYQSNINIDIAIESGQNLDQKVPYRDDNWKNSKTLRSRDATWSRYTGVDIKDLVFSKQIAQSHSGILYRGKWQNNDIVARVLRIPDVNTRISRDFQTEFPFLRLVLF